LKTKWKKRETMKTGKVLISTTEEKETMVVGEALGFIIKEPLVIAINGDLGAGKTTLVRGAALGLEVEGKIRSPTFNLLRVYRGRLPVYHFDFYRLEVEEELFDLGLEEYLEGQGVVFIEWANKFPSFLPGEYLEVYLERVCGEGGNRQEWRNLYFNPRGDYYERLLDIFLENTCYDFQGRINYRGRDIKEE